MRVIFPCDPLQSTPTCDPAFREDFEAAKALRIPTAFIDWEALNEGAAAERIISPLAESPEWETVVYRGWMLSPKKYNRLFGILSRKNWSLINHPREQEVAHWLPNAYKHLGHHTPRTVWLPKDFTMEGVHDLLASFGEKSVFLKDYAKSANVASRMTMPSKELRSFQEERWKEACFIPDTSDKANVERVVSKFMEIQGQIEGGLVFRKAIDLVKVHPEARDAEEYRFFILFGQVIGWGPRWPTATRGVTLQDFMVFQPLFKSFPASFFTIDIARTPDNNWVVIETGDGQVSERPSFFGAKRLFLGLQLGIEERERKERISESHG